MDWPKQWKKENKQYLKQYSEELKDFSFTLVTSVQEGNSLLSKFRFEIIYIILSGRLRRIFGNIWRKSTKINSVNVKYFFLF